jgi:hypothetical protein
MGLVGCDVLGQGQSALGECEGGSWRTKMQVTGSKGRRLVYTELRSGTQNGNSGYVPSNAAEPTVSENDNTCNETIGCIRPQGRDHTGNPAALCAKEEHMKHHAWVRFLPLGILLCAAHKPADAEPIDVTNAASVNVPSGARLDIVFPFPDLSLIGGVLPDGLFLDFIGPVPSEPDASYKFTSLLESLDGKTTITLPSVQGAAGTRGLRFFV